MESDQVRLSDTQQNNLAGYRAISRLAVFAAGLGVVSILALVHPILWFVPIVGVILAAVAMRSIASSDETLAGRKLALTGLALAMFFGTSAPARWLVERAFIARHGREFAEQWVELVRAGRIYEAHQWTLRPVQRVTTYDDLELHYEQNEEARQQLEAFFAEEPARSLRERGAAGQLHFVRTLSTAGDAKDSFSLHYFAISNDPGAKRALGFHVAVERVASSRGKSVQWQIRSVVPSDH